MGLPPGNSKFSTDTSPVTTFFWQFPNFTGSHSGVTATVGINSVAGGGTGLATLTAGSVLVGAGTSSPTLVAPSTSGNVLTSNGTTWISSPPASGGTATTFKMTAVGGEAPGANVPIKFPVTYDTASGWNSSTGYYTIPTSGYWLISGTFQTSAGTGDFYVNFNGIGLNYITTNTAINMLVSGSTQTYFAAGAQVSWLSDVNMTYNGSDTSYCIATLIQAGTASGAPGIIRSVNSVSTATTAGSTMATDYVYLVSGTTTLTLPTAVGNTNLYTVKNTGVATVTIATTSAQTIDGSSSASLPVANTSLDLISDGSNWRIV